MSEDLFRKELAVLVQRLRLWTPSRWAASCPPWGSRADAVRHLAQWCADLAADGEGTARRQLPVLSPDLLVADQLAVTGDDLLRVRPDLALLDEAVAHLLAHRVDLLDEEPPASLGGQGAVALGREVCARP